MGRQLPFDPTYVFFDGQCGTCHRIVRFLLKRRHRNRLRFVPLERVRGTWLEERIASDLAVDLQSTLVVWKNGTLYSRFPAVTAIFTDLSWPWNLVIVLRLIPLLLTGAIYDLYARYRYQIMGRAKDPDLCAVLPPAEQRLFPGQFPQDLPVFAPRPQVFLSAQWRHLVFVNFAVPPEALKAYLPVGTELDVWQGQTLVSLVAFAFTRTSLGGMTLPFCSDFEEVNLRFYVRRRLPGTQDVRRGVVFIKEIVPHSILALIARLFYGERYVREEMSSTHLAHGEETQISYTWGRGPSLCSVTVRVTGSTKSCDSDSLSGFITQHDYGYVTSVEGRTREYEVEHPHWTVWSPEDVAIQGDWLSRYPKTITQHMTQVHSVMVAQGSAVRVFRGRTLPAS